MLNLVSNAVKFTEKGWVRLSAVAKQRRIELRVAGTGRGIPHSRLDAIFDPFIHVRPHKGEDRGGVGLAISREPMRLMAGELAVDSEVDRGSTFHRRTATRLTDRSGAFREVSRLRRYRHKFLGGHAFRFSLEVHDDAVAQHRHGHGIYIFQIRY